MVSLIGIVAAKCKNTCSLILHIGLSVILLVGFGAICVLCGVWLGGKSIVNPLVADDITREDFESFCGNQTLIEANDTPDQSSEGMILKILLCVFYYQQLYDSF